MGQTLPLLTHIFIDKINTAKKFLLNDKCNAEINIDNGYHRIIHRRR